MRILDILDDDFIGKYEKLKHQHIAIMKSYGFDYKNYQLDEKPFEEYEKEWIAAAMEIRKLQTTNTENLINQQLKAGKHILAEGAQGTLLDIDFGSYPFVTSSNTITAGVCSGLGIAPTKIGKVYGIVKAYCTRVGSGPFPTELHDINGQKLRDEGHEYGATTGRPRRCGWLDLNALNYSVMLNGVTDLVLTKADVLSTFSEIKVCDRYEDKNGNRTTEFDIEKPDLKPLYKTMKGWHTSLNELTDASRFPKELTNYIKFIEENTGIPVSILSVGADRDKTIVL